MAYIDLEDNTGGMELLCFSRVLDESMAHIRENNAVVVSGRISARDEKEPQIMVDSIRPLTDADFAREEPRRRGAPPVAEDQKLWLKIPTRNDPRMEKIKLVLSFFPGKQQVILYYADCKRKVGTWAQIHPALVADLKERLGDENVVVK